MVCNHWQPGEILHISQGAKEVQEALNALADRLCVIHWLAPWSASNQELGVEEVFRRLVCTPQRPPITCKPTSQHMCVLQAGTRLPGSGVPAVVYFPKPQVPGAQSALGPQDCLQEGRLSAHG